MNVKETYCQKASQHGNISIHIVCVHPKSESALHGWLTSSKFKKLDIFRPENFILTHVLPIKKYLHCFSWTNMIYGTFLDVWKRRSELYSSFEMKT